ncbi:MAG: DUF58 domain-containing protein [Shewanella sp.]|nr:DUF58 domain-containing protein [Shewanella sp.]MCF1430188.1 DUF58 domain-containing protein [Shewanella sp.]MCF1459005.1 DUF58 domain-containing protein [Shewanella sp.]
MNKTTEFPLFADGWHLSEAELLACQGQANAIPDRHTRAKAALAGHRAGNIKGRGMEFAEVRHYQSGDDVRTIDWRVTARTGKAHTKLFIEERERPIILLLDMSYSLYFGSTLLLQSVQAAHLAATLGWSAINHGDRIGALIVSESGQLELKPKSRQIGILQLISGICEIHQQQLEHFKTGKRSEGHLTAACQRLARIAKPGSLVWIISDGSGFNADCIGPLSNLKRHCDIGAFVITDPLRQGNLNMPGEFSLPVRDGDTERLLNRIQYEQWLHRQQQQQQFFLTMMDRLRVRTRLIDAGKTLTQQLELLRS